MCSSSGASRKGPRPLLENPEVRERVLSAVAGGCPLRKLKAAGLPSANTVRAFASADSAFGEALDRATAAGHTNGAEAVRSQIDAAIAAIASGVRPKNLRSRGLMDVGRLNYYRLRSTEVDERVRAALVLAGNGPRAPFKERLKDLLLELEKGASLGAACDLACISRTDLARRRHRDRHLDRQVRARLSTVREFDSAAKAGVIEAVSSGLSIKRAMRSAGGFHPSTFRAHMASDSEFAYRIRQAVGTYEGLVLRPTPTKAKFEQVLALIPLTDTVTAACDRAGISVLRFNALVSASRSRREAYKAVVDRLDPAKRGSHRPRDSIVRRVEEVAELLRRGVYLAEACRQAGVGHAALNKLRRREPEFDRLIREAGHTGTCAGRRLLDDEARREHVLSLLRAGVPMYGLGLRGALAEVTVRAYARERPDFAAAVVSAMRAGVMVRRSNGPAELDAALGAIAAGVPEPNLVERGLPSAAVIRYYRNKDPVFAARYDAAKTMARGEVTYAKPLSVEELVELVAHRLPPNLTKDDRQTCINQAWLDAMTGKLTPANAREAMRRYLSEVRSLGSRGLYVAQNGDLRSAFQD